LLARTSFLSLREVSVVLDRARRR